MGVEVGGVVGVEVGVEVGVVRGERVGWWGRGGAEREQQRKGVKRDRGVKMNVYFVFVFLVVCCLMMMMMMLMIMMATLR